MLANEVLHSLKSKREAMLQMLGDLVNRETPSLDKVALDEFCSHLAELALGFGLHPETIANPDGGDHVLLQAEFGEVDLGMAPALVLGHFDTVWPSGTVRTRPFEVRGDRAFGPGAYDMKAGLVIALFALGALKTAGDLKRRVDVLLTSDEEIGSPTSRKLIEATAKGAAYVLVLEPALSDGSLKTARKGVGGYTITVRGKSAHAGIEPEKGANAIVELARQVLELQSLGNPAAGTTLNVGTIAGGTTPNVVPDSASCRVDVRASTVAEAERIDAAVRGLAVVNAGTSLQVSGGFNRPPMERTPAIAELFARAHALGLRLGMDLNEGSTGGGSDGNFTAALGIPTLDGLGALGGGAHALDEHVLIDSLPERASLLAALLACL